MIHCPKFQLGYADLPPAFFSEKFDIANGSKLKTLYKKGFHKIR